MGRPSSLVFITRRELALANRVADARTRTVLFLSAPARWPRWPLLPVVRRTRGREERGVVFDARTARLAGSVTTVVFCNLFALPPDFDSFFARPKEVFDGAEELADAGWRVG